MTRKGKEAASSSSQPPARKEQNPGCIKERLFKVEDFEGIPDLLVPAVAFMAVLLSFGWRKFISDLPCGKGDESDQKRTNVFNTPQNTPIISRVLSAVFYLSTTRLRFSNVNNTGVNTPRFRAGCHACCSQTLKFNSSLIQRL
ncbi:hypothetical protein OROMI_018796 [Orobanche minor]